MTDTTWTVPELLELSGGYWQTCALHAGVQLDLFTHLDDRELPAAELAAQLECDARALGMLLEALAAMALLEQRTGGYANTPAARKWLSRNSPDYQGHIIRHHHHLMESWSRLPEAVRSGTPIRDASRFGDAEWREAFLLGMFNLASNLAPHVARQLELSGARRLLDLGGGPGTYAIHFCQANPRLTATVFDLPTTREFAKQIIGRFGLSDRVAFCAGDFLRDRIPGGFDVVWLSHILHSEGPEDCAGIIRKAVSALEPGGKIFIQEFILDDESPGPLFPALFSLNMLLGTEKGKAYREGELKGMLEQAGVRKVHRPALDLPGPTGIVAGTV
jgi:SAM-dependent methyltransferase